VNKGNVTNNDVDAVLTKYDNERKRLQEKYWELIKDDARFGFGF
jgi:hypothetical protein